MKLNPIFIIDGYNFIHNVAPLSKHLNNNLEEARFNLELTIRNYLSLKKVKVYLVYDGAKVGYTEPDSSMNFKIIFSKPPQKADPIIKSLIKQFSNNNNLFVVTKDRDILKFAQQEGALSLTPEQFYRRMLKRKEPVDLDKKYEVKLSPEEIKEWLDIFNNHYPKQIDR